VLFRCPGDASFDWDWASSELLPSAPEPTARDTAAERASRSACESLVFGSKFVLVLVDSWLEATISKFMGMVLALPFLLKNENAAIELGPD